MKRQCGWWGEIKNQPSKYPQVKIWSLSQNLEMSWNFEGNSNKCHIFLSISFLSECKHNKTFYLGSSALRIPHLWRQFLMRYLRIILRERKFASEDAVDNWKNNKSMNSQPNHNSGEIKSKL
jgi:hypothetical protein